MAFMVLVAPSFAQRVTRTYHDTPMPEVLKDLNRAQSHYIINFVYDDLEDFRVSGSVSTADIPAAIRQLIGFYPISVSEKADGVLLVECMQKSRLRYKGSVVDTQGNPIAYANIALLSPEDSSLIAGGVSNESGYFAIPCDARSVIARVSFVGYKTLWRHASTTDLGTLRMTADSYTLSNVNVKAERIKKNANGYEIAIKGSGLEETNTVSEMLAFLPGVTVDNDNVMLLNRQPVIYVNGLKVVSQKELAALQTKKITKVKVDYLAVGEGATQQGGVIRITTQREKDGGMSGYLSESVNEMTKYGHQKDSHTFGIDAGKGRWTLNYYAMYDHRKLLEDAENTYDYQSGARVSSSDKFRSWSKTFSNRLNVSYQLDSRSTLALSEYIGNSDINNKRKSNVLNTLADGETTPSENTYHAPESNFTQQTVAKYAVNIDSLGSNFEVTADYLYTNYHLRQQTATDNVASTDDKTHESTNMVSVEPKWTSSYNNGNELQVGANYQYIGQAITTNDDISTKAHTASAYANYDGSWKSLMYSAGLTLQYNYMKVSQQGTATKIDNTYLCPQANLAWVIDSKHQTMLTLMYQRRVEDMPYSIVSDYRNYGSYSHYTTGNPSLKTPNMHIFDIRFALNRHFTFAFSCMYEDDAIYYTHGVDADNPLVTYSRPENGNYERSIVGGVESSLNPAKWWTTKLNISIQQTKFSSPAFTANGKACGKFRWNNQFTFSKTFGGSLSAYWETGMSFEEYSWRPVGSINASIYKRLFNNNLRLSLASNICGRGRKSAIISDDYTSRYWNRTSPTAFTFTATWFFSKGKKVKQRMEAESIQQYEKIEEMK